MTRSKAIVGYASILIVCFGLALAARFDSAHNYAVAKQHFVESAHADAVSAATQVQGKLRAIYENLRTLTFLPSVQNIERHGANLGEEGRTTIQQVYNNLASSVSVSEVYIVPAAFDPERIDPQTGKPEEPILMFDELIVNAASHLPKSDARELPVPKNAAAEEIEIYEYRQLKQQIAWLNQKYPSASYISGLEVPIISGPEIITCDNNKYIHTGRDADRSGVMFSIPFFDKVGLLKGTVTAIILTDALRKMLPSQDFALINHGYGYVAPSSGSGQEQSSASWVAQNKPDTGLIYSEILPLSLNDPQSGWKIWAGRPNQSFYDGAEVKAVHAAEYAFYAVIAILLLAATVCWWLIVRSMRLAASARSQLEQRVDERTREIGYLATHDVLTGLPNRAQLRDKLTEALACLGDGERLAVLYVDLDRFKQVNDTLGHAIGDELLKAMVARVKGCIRPTDIVARLGGDEFVVVQRRLVSVDDAERLAKDVIEAAGRSFDLDGHHVVVGASIGIAIAPADGGTAELLLKNADMALYRAKGDGRGTCRYFESSMDARLQQRRRLEIDLRRALAESEFVLHYQAQVVAQTSEIVGFEALVRWNHPTRGLVSPAEFIPLAEEIGLIVPLGEWILRRACADAAAWPKDVKVAVNLSPLQFKRQTLSHMVVSALAASSLPAHRLELEITETALLAETESTLATLHQLRTLGVRIAMDDFGTGYSSLSYLRSFPFDKIKIDRSFVRDLGNSPDCVAIIKAVAGLGESLGMTTTAEGVETKEQLAMVSEQGCTEVQGYYFSAARPVQEIMAMLATAARMRTA